MTQKVRVGVIGTGGVAFARHFPAYEAACQQGKAELVAVADPVEADRKRAAQEYGIANAFADYRDLLGLPDLDAVSVCTPNVYHEPISLAAIEAGKHVMCEKPLAMGYAGARRMYEGAKRAGLRTGVNFRYRYIPAATFVRDLVRSGELGEVYHVYVNYFGGSLASPDAPLRWRMVKSQTGTGALGDYGSHLVDLCRFWLGELEGVCGHFRTFVDERPALEGGTGQVDVDDAASWLARFVGGAEGAFHATRYALGRNNHQRAEIYGSKGAVIYEIEKWDVGGDQLQICLGTSQARYSGFSTIKVPPEYLAGTPLRPMTDFVDSILSDGSGSTDPAAGDLVPTFYDGLRAQEVLDAVELSSREGTWVQLPLRE